MQVQQYSIHTCVTYGYEYGNETARGIGNGMEHRIGIPLEMVSEEKVREERRRRQLVHLVSKARHRHLYTIPDTRVPTRLRVREAI